jgi:hypothetical protein
MTGARRFAGEIKPEGDDGPPEEEAEPAAKAVRRGGILVTTYKVLTQMYSSTLTEQSGSREGQPEQEAGEDESPKSQIKQVRFSRIRR